MLQINDGFVRTHGEEKTLNESFYCKGRQFYRTTMNTPVINRERNAVNDS